MAKPRGDIKAIDWNEMRHAELVAHKACKKLDLSLDIRTYKTRQRCRKVRPLICPAMAWNMECMPAVIPNLIQAICLLISDLQDIMCSK